MAGGIKTFLIALACSTLADFLLRVVQSYLNWHDRFDNGYIVGFVCTAVIWSRMERE